MRHSPQIGLLHRIKSEAAIDLTFDLRCRAIAALFIILYSNIWGYCYYRFVRSQNDIQPRHSRKNGDYVQPCKIIVILLYFFGWNQQQTTGHDDYLCNCHLCYYVFFNLLWLNKNDCNIYVFCVCLWMNLAIWLLYYAWKQQCYMYMWPIQQKVHLVGQVYPEIMNQIVCKI